jgi:hypothetical protein
MYWLLAIKAAQEAMRIEERDRLEVVNETTAKRRVLFLKTNGI